MIDENGMESLFPEFENEWQKEWKDMPEFIAEDKSPSQQIIVSFRNFQDVKEFARRLDLKVTPDTISTWFPKREFDTGEVYLNDNWGKDEE